MTKLFLLKADFTDAKRDESKLYFCPHCAVIEGLLSYYPRLRDELDVNYVNFARPRQVIVDLIGEDNQSCPVLVLEDGTFINETNEIIQHLIDNHRIGEQH